MTRLGKLLFFSVFTVACCVTAPAETPQVEAVIARPTPVPIPCPGGIPEPFPTPTPDDSTPTEIIKTPVITPTEPPFPPPTKVVKKDKMVKKKEAALELKERAEIQQVVLEYQTEKLNNLEDDMQELEALIRARIENDYETQDAAPPVP